MQDNQKNPSERRRVTLFRVMMALLLVAGCAFVAFRLSLRSKLNARIEAIRAAGYPVTPAELDRWHSIPDDAENAAYTITGAFFHYVKAQNDKLLPLAGRAGLPPRTEPLTEETKAAVVQYLADNKDALELLHAGAAIEHCRYPVNLADGADAAAPHISEIRTGVMLLELEGILHAENDEPSLAAQSLTATLGIARSLEMEPAFISQLTRGACLRYAVSGLERIVNRTELTDEQLAELSRTLIEAENVSSTIRAFVGERCASLAILRMPPAEMSRILLLLANLKESSKVASHLGPAKLALHKFAGLTDRRTIILLDLFEDYVEASGLALDDRRERIEKIDARCGAICNTDSVLSHLIRRLPRVDERNLTGIAHLRAARAALAIQRYRLARGRLADVLGDLVPTYLDAVPSDPFDGEKLRYKKLDPGFVVYSIGEDRDDDGGRERQPAGQSARRSDECDVTFIVER